MRVICKGLAGTLLSAAALLTAASGVSIGAASDARGAAPVAADAGVENAAPPPPDGMPHPGHRHVGMEGLYEKLNLTAEQQASIQSMLLAAKPQLSNLQQQMRANHRKLQQTRPDDPNYGNVVAEVAQSNATLASQRTTQGAELRAQMYAVLTPAQRTQLAALQAQWEANPRRGHWGRHGPGTDGNGAGAIG